MTFIQRNSIDDRLRTNIVSKNYEVGDLIHYTGKCYNYNNFYAVINRMTETSIDIEVLEWKLNQNTGLHEFKSLEPRVVFTNLTGRRAFEKINI